MKENPTATRVHQAIARALVHNGVDTMFGLMGDGNMFMANSFIKECGGNFVPAAHEVGAALMALGYAAMTGRVAICSVTHGPAMLNVTTALVQGLRASLPLLVIAGDTPSMHLQHAQRITHRDFVLAAGAGFEQLRAPSTVAEDVARALRRAEVERRPVVLNVPVDFDWLEAKDFEPLRVRLPDRRATVSSSDDIDEAVGMIAAAKRPIIVAGRGATSAESKAALLRLAERIGAPVGTTLKAKDLFRGDPFNIGIYGTLSSELATEIVAESDCIISFGASLTFRTMPAGVFKDGKRIVQVNAEPGEVGKNFPPSAGLIGYPATVADIIFHWLDEAEIPSSGFRSDEMAARLAQPAKFRVAPKPEADGTVDIFEALARLERLLPESRIVVTDAGRFSHIVWTSVQVRGPDSFLPTGDFGSIGFSIPHAIGASFARPDQPVVAFCGDGAFMHGGLAEFNTAVRTGRDLIVVLCNDQSYGAEHVKFVGRQLDPGVCMFDWPDFSDVARSLGGEGVRVCSAGDWDKADRAIRSRSAPLLIDVRLDPDAVPWHGG